MLGKCFVSNIMSIAKQFTTYDHNHLKTRDPVRSPIVKQVSAGLVVRSVTTSEYPVLYVFFVLFLLFAVLTVVIFSMNKSALCGCLV
jgi:hypothetical protein